VGGVGDVQRFRVMVRVNMLLDSPDLEIELLLTITLNEMSVRLVRS